LIATQDISISVNTFLSLLEEDKRTDGRTDGQTDGW